MEKKVIKKTKLNNGKDAVVTIRRNITTVKGDEWEGRPSETLHLEEICISTTHPVTNKKIFGSSISILDPNNPFDKEGIKKGAFARVGLANGFYLSKNNYSLIKKCYEEALKECEFKEWTEYVQKIKEKREKEKINYANRVMSLAEKEINANGKLMSEREKIEWERNYNNIMNEGCDGFVPDHITKEDYESAKKIIETIK